MSIKAIAKKFILSTYKEDDGFFEAVWEHLSAHYHDLGQSLETKSKITKGGLGISGAESRPSMNAMMILMAAEKGLMQIQLRMPEEIMAFIQNTAIKHGEEHLARLFEKFVEKHGINILENKVETVSCCYAQMWTKDIGIEGKKITREEFDKQIASKQNFDVFIVDEGEYEQGHVGMIYSKGNLWSKIEDESKDEKKEGYLSPLTYRILVHTLKNRYKAGNTPLLFDKCWNEPQRAKNLKKISKYERSEQQGKCRKTFSLLNKILIKEIGSQIKAADDGIYYMTPKSLYCVICINIA